MDKEPFSSTCMCGPETMATKSPDEIVEDGDVDEGCGAISAGPLLGRGALALDVVSFFHW